MSIIWAFILGAIQGITEILPISSSAHLILAPKLFNLPDQGLSFDVALHLGSLLAIIIAFKNDWAKILKSILEIPKKNFKNHTQEQRLIYFLIVGSIPGAIAGIFLEDLADSLFRSEYIILLTLIIYGLLLWFAEKIGKKTKDLKKITLKDSLLIGLAQALALIPGTSRSGVTITVGLFSGLNKETAAKFSFMLSAPIIMGAGLIKVTQIPVSQLLSAPIITGFISACIFALISIKFLISFVKNSSYKWFSIYRFALATLIAIFIIGN